MVIVSEPIFLTLVRAFYSRATYGMGGSIISTVRGVEIHLNPESICRIFDILSIRLGVYESKMWPIMPGFEPREAIQRICGLPDAKGMGKPSAHSLTVITEYCTICCALFFYHEVDAKMRSLIMRHSLLTSF